jgi:hypothetical protein
MSGRDVIAVLVVLMIAGVLAWSVKGVGLHLRDDAPLRTLVALIMCGLLLWVLAWRLETRGPQERPQL